MPSTPLQAQQPKASNAPLPYLLLPITATDELRCASKAVGARHPHLGARSCCFAGSQVQQAASRLSVAKLSGGLFRGSSGGADDMAAAPAAVSSCVGNWLSHLDWDGTRFAPQSAFAICQYVCVVSQLAGMQCGGKAKTDMSAPNTLLGHCAESNMPYGALPYGAQQSVQDVDPGRGAARDVAAGGGPAAQRLPVHYIMDPCLRQAPCRVCRPMCRRP